MYKIGSVFRLRATETSDSNKEVLIRAMESLESHCVVLSWDYNKGTDNKFHEYITNLNNDKIKELYEEVK